MRKLDNNRIEEYLKKHVSLKKWVSIMLVVALLVTTVTMYSLNKSANALSDDAADDVGMVLEGEDIEQLASGNEDAGDTDSITDSESEDGSDGESTEEETSEDGNSEEGNSEGDKSENGSSEDGNTEEGSADEANGEEGTSNETNSDDTTDVADASTDNTSEDGENEDSSNETEGLKDSNDVELTEDVVLTVSYVTEDGEQIADEKEINLSESLDFTTEAPKQEGYKFKKAEIDGTEISMITAKQNINGYRYYEVTVGKSTTEDEDATEESTTTEDTSDKSDSTENVSDDGISNETSTDEDSVDGEFTNKSASEEEPSENSASDNAASEENDSNDTTSEETSSDNSLESATDGDVVAIKENKTVVLTYKSDKATKTEYVYEDEKVRVTATLETADAVPDDAEFVVKEVTTETEGYNYDAYMKALNDGEEQGIKNHNAMNTILYDVGFFVNKTDEEGNVIEGEKVEYQPKEGSVTVKFEFLDSQMSDLLESTDNEAEIEIDHLPLNENVKESTDSTSEATNIDATDIQKEKVGTVNESAGENVEISLDNFSIVGFSAVKGNSSVYTFKKGNRTLTYAENSTKDAYRTSSYYDDSLALGVAGNFHIVAFDTAKLSTHTNGNVLARTLYAGTNFGTNNIENELSYAQNFTAVNERMASKEEHTLVVGDKVTVGLWGNEGLFSVNNTKVAAPYNIIQDTSTGSTPYIDLATVKSEIKAMSSKMAATEAGDVKVTDGSGGQKIITYTGLGGAGYLNYTGSQWNSLVANKELQFEFPNDLEHQSIIININCADVTNVMHPTKATVITVNSTALSTGEEKAVKAGRVVYNFYNCDGKNIDMVEVFGQIIAVGANLTVTNGNGNFVAENVTITGETHRRDFVGTTEKGALVSIEAKKLVNGKEPSAEQVYTFKAQKMNRPSEKSSALEFTDKVITGKNTGSKLSIDVSEFIENKTGNYYVLISEEAGTDTSVTYDKTQYLAEIHISSKKDGNKTIYYADSIQYYGDNWTKINSENVVFNNSINEQPVKISAQKYVDDQLAGNDTTGKFGFTLRMLDTDGKSWKKDANGNVKTATIKNNGSEISYDISPAEWGMTYGCDSSKTGDPNYQKEHTYYFMLTENDVEGYAKDSSGILIKIKHYVNGEVNYYRITSDEVKTMESNPDDGFYNNDRRIKDSNNNSDKKYNNVAFYNTTGGGMLRIHKMVINDFGSDLVRDSDASILNGCRFKITNTVTKDYIVVHGFTGHAKDTNKALEYHSNHSLTGKQYTVTYNQGAQWTIEGLSAGTYTVEEVGDGFTFVYDEEKDTNSLKPDSKWSRVTKYDVTVDKETTNTAYGTGGNNERVVFSADLSTDGNTEAHHLDVCPVVSVGDTSVNNTSHTQTAQICNYYSIPVGPIRITKKFTGGTWKDMNFTFNIEAVSCIARDSAGAEIPGVSVPMPERTSVTLANPTTTENDAVSSAIADFGAIAFRYEGEYFYKITEANTGIDGVKYDSNVYYVKIDVKKKYTTAKKSYTSGNMTDLAKYKNNGERTTIDDDFYYLGADITYTNGKGEVKAKYELYLKPVEKTDGKFASEFDIIKKEGSIDDVVFTNSIAGHLTVNKVWYDSAGNDESEKHSSLRLSIWQRVKGTNQWNKYGEDIVLAPNVEADKNWRATVSDLPIVDENGKPYEYTVKEADSYAQTCNVTYAYTDPNGKTSTITANDLLNDNNKITVNGESTYDTGYAMTNSDINYGEVTITNTSVTVNVLPESGGEGTIPYTAAGAVLIVLAIGAIFLYRRRKKV
ncbi:MAG: choice-of-anchor A family protein [Butyrivibrio sp.]|nr:choice-of-anchor A family protein [Butyrivibrio sp.]